MKVEEKITCPDCGKDAKKQEQLKTFNYKGKSIEIPYLNYKCSNCGAEYTTGEVDDINLNTMKVIHSKL